MLKTFESCPYKYYLKYIKKISVPQKMSYFEKGKRIHALANYYLRGDDISKLEKTLSPEEQKIWTNLKNNEFFQMSYVNSEYNLSCKVGKYWVGGRLDAIVKNNSNPSPQKSEGVNYFILDYKTGSIPKNPEYDFQTMVYLLCLYKLNCHSEAINNEILRSAQNDREPKNLINFVYIDLKNNQNHIIKLTPEKIKEYEQAIIKTCNEITNYKPPENIEHKKMCEFCEFRKICI